MLGTPGASKRLAQADHPAARPSRPDLQTPPTAPPRVLFQGCLSSGAERQLHVRAGQTEFSTRLHAAPQSVRQSLGPVQVLLPADLAGARPPGPQVQSLCYISQLVLSKKDPYPGARTSAQVQPSDDCRSLAVQFQAVPPSLLTSGKKKKSQQN